MRFEILLLAGVLVSQTAAAQSPQAETCRKGDDERLIRVLAPGNVGAACDVVYVRNGGANVAVPYNANVDKDYCRARAAEIAANLIAEGFTCSTEASATLEASLAGGPNTAEPADEIVAPPAEIAATDDSLDAQLGKIAAAQSPVADAQAPQERLDQPTSETVAEIDEPSTAIVETPETRLPVEPASAEPIQLASDVRASEFKAPRPSKETGAGRLVGAQPEIEDIIDVATATPVIDPKAAAEADQAGIPARKAEDIIRSVVAANAAAWNEGNLDAYMGGYANSAGLLMVVDAVVTTGWQPVRKLYEKDIAASGEMGRLSFDKLDVKMTSDDVATVVGRYSLVRASAAYQGVMTLLMKQVDGRWRIVQDTRIADGRIKD
jgi:ketosteroid isomerase-like protein